MRGGGVGTAQNGVDGGAGNAQPPPDAMRTPGKHASCSADGRFLQLIGLAGAVQGTAGAVKERVGPAFAEPPYPLGNGSAGDADKQATSAWGQPDNTCSTNSARVTGVKRALRWVMRGLLSLLVWLHNSNSGASHLSTTSMGTTPRWATRLPYRIASEPYWRAFAEYVLSRAIEQQGALPLNLYLVFRTVASEQSCPDRAPDGSLW